MPGQERKPGEDQMDEVMIPITMFAMIAAIVIVPTWLKSKERRDMQATLRASIDKGQALPPEPPRVCRRPQLLRGRGHDKQDDEQVFT
jgi:hypothetical protein